MFETLLGTFETVQAGISSGVERLRVNVAPTLATQRCSQQAVEELANTNAGSNLLLKYQTHLEELRETGNDNIRLANLCSTRMGRAQQLCKERAAAVMEIDDFLRNISEVQKKISEVNRQVDKLQRFCDQTELAFTHLDALCAIVRAEEEVELIRERSRIVSAVVAPPPQVSHSVLAQPPHVAASDSARQNQEEVMLEEFLSTKP